MINIHEYNLESNNWQLGKYNQTNKQIVETLLKNSTTASVKNDTYDIHDSQTKLNLPLNQSTLTNETNLSGDLPTNASDESLQQLTSYKGPIVLGWPPDKNMSLVKYILPNDESTFLIIPSQNKTENCTMLIVIFSLPGTDP